MSCLHSAFGYRIVLFSENVKDSLWVFKRYKYSKQAIYLVCTSLSQCQYKQTLEDTEGVLGISHLRLKLFHSPFSFPCKCLWNRGRIHYWTLILTRTPSTVLYSFLKTLKNKIPFSVRQIFHSLSVLSFDPVASQLPSTEKLQHVTYLKNWHLLSVSVVAENTILKNQKKKCQADIILSCCLKETENIGRNFRTNWE